MSPRRGSAPHRRPREEWALLRAACARGPRSPRAAWPSFRPLLLCPKTHPLLYRSTITGVTSVRKLDIFNHIWPKAFQTKLEQVCKIVDITKRSNDIPMMSDLDERFRVMDRFDEYQQVLSLASPPLEVVAGPKDAADLARIGNDGMAEIAQKHPDRFPGFVASIAMSDMDAALAETQRAIDDLGAAGVQIFTNVNGRPLDEPE